LAYILARATGKVAGPFLGSLAAGLPLQRAGFFTQAFLSQSAVAIGLSLLAQDTYPALGGQINAIVLGAVILFELVGPYLLKNFFESTGECYQEAADLLAASSEELAVSKVVVPIGLKAPSEARVKVVTELTKKMKGNVVALHIQRKFSQEKRIPLHSSAEKALKRFKELAEAEGIEVDIRIEVSERVAETICRVAQEEAADLIIMGASGRSGLLTRLTASISDKVAKGAKCPVLIMVD
jgi:nucleotide-binding universal stress UspA family protein